MYQPSSASKSFDKETFLANFQGMEDLAQQTVISFLEALPKMVDSIEGAIRSENPIDLQLSAHALKGSISNFYAEPSRILAWKLEQMGYGPVDKMAWVIFDELKVELERLITELKHYLQSQR